MKRRRRPKKKKKKKKKKRTARDAQQDKIASCITKGRKRWRFTYSSFLFSFFPLLRDFRRNKKAKLLHWHAGKLQNITKLSDNGERKERSGESLLCSTGCNATNGYLHFPFIRIFLAAGHFHRIRTLLILRSFRKLPREVVRERMKWQEWEKSQRREKIAKQVCKWKLQGCARSVGTTKRERERERERPVLIFVYDQSI